MKGRCAVKSTAICTAAALAIATAISGTANAQSQPSQDRSVGSMMEEGPGGMMRSNGMGPWMMGRGGGSGHAMCNAMTGHIEGRLAFIKAELKITDAQEALWNAYAAAARDNAGVMRGRCAATMSRTSALSLPDRLDQHEQIMAAQLDAVRASNKALKPLYAALNDGQKQAADQLFWGPKGMM